MAGKSDTKNTPTDAIISEHLGDAYWQTGRFAEARFKWQHAHQMGIEESRQRGSEGQTGKRPVR